MDLLLLQGRGFSFGLYLHVCVSLGTCDVICGPTNTIMAGEKRRRGERGCHGSFVRRGSENQGGVLLVFSLHRHTRRQCFVSVREKKQRRLGKEGGGQERERNKAKIENGKCFG